MNEPLLMTGSEIRKVFNTTLLFHVARYAILSQTGIITVKLDSVLCWLRLIS